MTLHETDHVWGPCVGYVLPTPGATKGAAACKCFSAGQWAIANLSPCFYQSGANYTAISTYLSGANAMCPSSPTMPMGDWSTDTLKVDCAGHFKLCYELKAGNGMMPMPSDCSVAKVCVEADYLTANQVQTFPPLPGWVGSNGACATQFATTGGYGEMSVVGDSVTCDKVDDGNGGSYVFNRVQYCPLSCNMNPMGAGCMNCMQGGSGGF
jgi:hypothetical protein